MSDQGIVIGLAAVGSLLLLNSILNVTRSNINNSDIERILSSPAFQTRFQQTPVLSPDERRVMPGGKRKTKRTKRT